MQMFIVLLVYVFKLKLQGVEINDKIRWFVTLHTWGMSKNESIVQLARWDGDSTVHLRNLYTIIYAFIVYFLILLVVDYTCLMVGWSVNKEWISVLKEAVVA